MSYNLILHLFVFMGSFLLFTMEPMVARIILPNFGGAFHVWSITITFFQGDVNNTSLLNTIFTTSRIDAVIHCAGLKAVSESIEEPEKYHQNNVEGAKNLINAMHENKVFNLVFSKNHMMI